MRGHDADGRRLQGSGYGDDDGSPDPRLLAAIGTSDRGRILAALTTARLLVPVVAILGEMEYDAEGRPRDKSSDMAVALLTGRDGRQAMLAFTGTAALHRWRPDARPMPAATALVATAALQEGATAIVLDIADPQSVVLESDDLPHLAAGHTVIRLPDNTHAWAHPPA